MNISSAVTSNIVTKRTFFRGEQVYCDPFPLTWAKKKEEKKKGKKRKEKERKDEFLVFLDLIKTSKRLARLSPS